MTAINLPPIILQTSPPEVIEDSGIIIFTPKSPFNTYGSGFQYPYYRKIGSLVYLGGFMRLGAASVAFQEVTTLPVGYRPAQDHSFVTYNTGVTNEDAQRTDIRDDGFVCPAVAMVASAFYCLDGIVFPAASAATRPAPPEGPDREPK